MKRAEAKIPTPVRKHKGFRAKVSAKWLPVLRHFMSDHEPDFSPPTYGLHIEPHPDGGITAMATNGKIMAVVHDRDGETSEPVRVMLSATMLDACEPPKLPQLWDEGEWLAPPEVPEWMSPKWLYLWEVAAWVQPDGKNPPGLLAHDMIEEGNEWRTGQEYRIMDGAPLPWGPCVPTEQVQFTEGLHVNPLFLGRICIAAHSAGAKSILIKATGPDKPVLVEFIGVPEVTIVLMPIRHPNNISNSRSST